MNVLVIMLITEMLAGNPGITPDNIDQIANAIRKATDHLAHTTSLAFVAREIENVLSIYGVRIGERNEVS